jgi:RNA polymerase sigma factor (TIGR02999 family)
VIAGLAGSPQGAAVTGEGQVTRLLAAISDGRADADELLVTVYDTLRSLARRTMATEPPGHTLQPTALVHEAYLRLVGDGNVGWNSRGHFYAAAAHAMRRILVERARRVRQLKRGGGRRRVPLRDVSAGDPLGEDDIVALDAALAHLGAQDARMHDVVMLRYFAGLSIDDTAAALGIAPRTVDRTWRCARLRLYEQIVEEEDEESRHGR